MNNIHSGSSFDDFLKEEGLLADVEATAIKRVVAYQIGKTVESRTCLEILQLNIPP
jgi:hypothetical protein